MGAEVFNILQFLLFAIGRRIPLEEVPEDEQECSNWLHKLYQEKVGFLSRQHLQTTGAQLFILLVDLYRVHVSSSCFGDLGFVCFSG